MIGGEKAFRKEVLAKYALECDISWALLQSIARENANRYTALQTASSLRELDQPFAIVIAGQPGSGRSTLAKRLAQQYGLIRVSSGDLLRRSLQGCAPSSLPILNAAELQCIRSAFNSGECVQDEIVTKLIHARLMDADVQRQGVVLDGYPRTEIQANSLRDMENTVSIRIASFLRLESLPTNTLVQRMEGRRIDPVTDEIYHTVDVLPSSALIMSRLTRRIDDQADNNTCVIQLRAYEQQKSHVARLFKSVLIDLASTGTSHEIFDRAIAILDPLAAKIHANRAKAAAARLLHPSTQRSLSPTPISSSTTSPVLQPVTPTVASIADNVVAQPLSRRSSQVLTNSASASKLAGSKPNSKANSRVGSRVGSRAGSRAGSRRASANAPLPIDPKALNASAAAAAVALTSSSSSSKPASRRGSAKLTPTISSSAAVVEPTLLVAAPGSRRVSLNRRSSRASGNTPLIPTAALKSVAAPAVEKVSSSSSSSGQPASKPSSKRSSEITPTLPVTEKRATADKPIVVSRPISASSKRTSRDTPLTTAATTTAAVAVAVPVIAAAAEEEVILHRKTSKRQSSINASASTSPKPESIQPVTLAADFEIQSAQAETTTAQPSEEQVKETTEVDAAPSAEDAAEENAAENAAEEDTAEAVAEADAAEEAVAAEAEAEGQEAEADGEMEAEAAEAEAEAEEPQQEEEAQEADAEADAEEADEAEQVDADEESDEGEAEVDEAEAEAEEAAADEQLTNEEEAAGEQVEANDAEAEETEAAVDDNEQGGDQEDHEEEAQPTDEEEE